jgi:transposase InsO family protein
MRPYSYSEFFKYNDKYKYLLSAIVVFSKFLNFVPLRAKTCTAVAMEFRSIIAQYSHRRPICVRTDRGKEFLNRSFQDILKKEGIQYQVCRDPNVKCSVIEHSHCTIRDKMYKYITYKNMYRYIDVLPKFIKDYNDTIHSTTGMAPSKGTDTDMLKICRRM